MTIGCTGHQKHAAKISLSNDSSNQMYLASETAAKISSSIVKTIRLRMKDLVISGDLIDPNIKLLVLVRDPRATLHSMHSESTIGFPPISRNPERLCNHILEDVILADQVNAHVVRYEDAVLKPEETLRDVQAFLGTPEAFDLTMEEVNRRVVDPSTNQYNTEGFRTMYKTSNFNPNSWRDDKNFKEKYLDKIQIEPKCLQVLKLLGYEY